MKQQKSSNMSEPKLIVWQEQNGLRCIVVAKTIVYSTFEQLLREHNERV